MVPLTGTCYNRFRFRYHFQKPITHVPVFVPEILTACLVVFTPICRVHYGDDLGSKTSRVQQSRLRHHYSRHHAPPRTPYLPSLPRGNLHRFESQARPHYSPTHHHFRDEDRPKQRRISINKPNNHQYE